MSGVLARLGVLPACRAEPVRAPARDETAGSGDDVLRGLGLRRSDGVWYEATPSGRVVARRHAALPDAAGLRARVQAWR